MSEQNTYNETGLETLCAGLCEALGIPAPETAAKGSPAFSEYLASGTKDKKIDRIFMYNPDAVAQWIYRKYPTYVREVLALCDFEMPCTAVMPSVTPVCFGTMYTGALPEVHGIRRYEKPVIRIDTIFDALIRSGKKAAIVADDGCSLSRIFLERNIDYFFYNSLAEINAKASELIMEDNYDFIVVYNGNYDSVMHKFGPESPEALAELRANSQAFGTFYHLIKEKWQTHKTLLGFAMDHGCHEIDGGCGSHGLDMPEDINILHSYKIL